VVTGSFLTNPSFDIKSYKMKQMIQCYLPFLHIAFD
jgi:hypothetical protein